MLGFAKSSIQSTRSSCAPRPDVVRDAQRSRSPPPARSTAKRGGEGSGAGGASHERRRPLKHPPPPTPPHHSLRSRGEGSVGGAASSLAHRQERATLPSRDRKRGEGAHREPGSVREPDSFICVWGVGGRPLLLLPRRHIARCLARRSIALFPSRQGFAGREGEGRRRRAANLTGRPPAGPRKIMLERSRLGRQAAAASNCFPPQWRSMRHPLRMQHRLRVHPLPRRAPGAGGVQGSG
jgi:hypothetical protein